MTNSYLKAVKNIPLPVTDNLNTNQFFNYINDLIASIENTIVNHNSKHKGKAYTGADFELDLEQFKSLTKEANETSTLAATWLKLNQGIP